MSPRSLAPPIAVMLLVLTIGTVVHGIITDRFGMVVSQELREFTERLDNVPNVIGDWEGVEATLPQEELERAKVTGHVSRVYTHRETGTSVSLFLVCGTSRHITLHTPDLCYRARGFELESEPQQRTIDISDTEQAEFSDGRFYKEEGHQIERLRILWAFSDDGNWLGPRSARTAMAGKDALYKIYLMGPMPEPGDVDNSAIEEFARDALPIINNALFGDEEARNRRETS